MLMRPRVGRRIVRTAAVGGAAYLAGSHVAQKSMEEQQREAYQDAQIAELQQQQQAAQPVAAPPPPTPQYAPQYAPTATPVAPPDVSAKPDPIDALKRLGELKAAGVLTDAEFEAKKADLLSQI